MGVPKYDMLTARKLIHSFVPISRFNKGEAGKIIEGVKEEGICLVVKNNAPECIMLSLEEYDRLIKLSQRRIIVNFTKEEEEKRKAFIKKIRERAAPPIPASADRKTVMDRIGMIDVDEDAVNNLRRISVL